MVDVTQITWGRTRTAWPDPAIDRIAVSGLGHRSRGHSFDMNALEVLLLVLMVLALRTVFSTLRHSR